MHHWRFSSTEIPPRNSYQCPPQWLLRVIRDVLRSFAAEMRGKLCGAYASPRCHYVWHNNGSIFLLIWLLPTRSMHPLTRVINPDASGRGPVGWQFKRIGQAKVAYNVTTTEYLDRGKNMFQNFLPEVLEALLRHHFCSRIWSRVYWMVGPTP